MASPGEKHEDHGSQIWGLGYASSNDESDDDAADMELTEDEARTNAKIAEKILKGDDIQEDRETIADSTRLRDVYNNRWWNPSLDQTYFTMYNYSTKKIEKGSQIIF